MASKGFILRIFPYQQTDETAISLNREQQVKGDGININGNVSHTLTIPYFRFITDAQPSAEASVVSFYKKNIS